MLLRQLLRRREWLELVRAYEEELRFQEAQLRMLVGRIEIIRLENEARRMEFSRRRGLHQLEKLLDKINGEEEYRVKEEEVGKIVQYVRQHQEDLSY